MIKILALIFIALIAGHTQALELDVGIGYTQTAKPVNGYWYQDGFDHKLNDTSPSAHIGLRFHATDKLDLIIGYKYMGEFSSDAMASSSDANYAAWQKGDEDIWPLARWEGSGKVHGFYGTAEYNFDHFFVTAGAFYHVSTWKMKITDWRCDSRAASCDEAFPGAPYSAPMPLTVNAEEEYQLGLTFGIGKKFGAFSVAYESTQIERKGDFPPIYAGRADRLSVTYTF